MLLRRILILGMAIGAVGAFGQSTQRVRETSSIPDAVVFELFFQHVASVDAQAAKLEAEGEPRGNVLRGQLRGWAQLNPQEAQEVISLARAYQSEFKRLEDTVQPLLESARTESGGSAAAARDQIRTLQSAREQLAADYAARLQKEMGDNRFSRLNTHVRKIMRVKGYELRPRESR